MEMEQRQRPNENEEERAKGEGGASVVGSFATRPVMKSGGDSGAGNRPKGGAGCSLKV